MSRARDAVTAVGLLALGALAGASAPRPEGTAAGALGGLRPLVVDALFLRADALRRRGRHEEVATLYRSVLDLEPDSEAATDFLAATEAYDLRAEAPTAEGRVRWHRSALDLVSRALARAPDSARLRWRAADLLVHVPDADPAVSDALARAGRDRLGEALRHLLVAVRATDSIPRLGREHLDDVSRLAPRVAAERLARGGDGVDEALAAGDEALDRRGATLREILAHPGTERTAYHRLRGGLVLVRETRRALRETPGDLSRPRRLLEAYRGELGDDAVVRALTPVLR